MISVVAYSSHFHVSLMIKYYVKKAEFYIESKEM